MTAILALRVALRALLRNKTRSALTMLGVVIGVAAVIATVGIGDGARARVQQTFAAMGTNLLVVLPGSTSSGGVHGGFGSAPTLTWDDVRAIRAELPAVRHASPQLRSSAQLASDRQNWNTQVWGTNEEFFAIRSWAAAAGRAFDASDVEARAKVVVLGQTVVERLYGPGVSPVGEQVRIGNVPFEVVGVLQRKGQSGFGQDLDDAAVVPVTTFQARVQGGPSGFVVGPVLVSARSAELTGAAQEQITGLLRERHRLEEGREDDFSVRNLAEVAEAQQESANVMALLLASVAAVSLLVGGIGIMNIMLVSVTERTREIGIRAAVGAKPRHLLAQFLAESAALSTLGGVAGVGLGLAVARQLAARFGWLTAVRPDAIALALGFSAMVGVAFGLYPAWRASRLDPIQALRYE
jgi:putative ABC transport system permease protein